ncbi:hypothetical protein KZO01_19200 [Kurthia zopfii]|uniref:Uncharacterized protein n=1 Tax=Kurthia zopfii TaxID=1650 RepID=A0A2U3AA92_9BACL|nr:DUF2197 domain-containing protein [Kurthia zopfii]TDR34560.1 hypothetical protein DFR61_13729 [Kurthia zopfii]GEK31611.1 hypothetical protein KZO01_19200 [Kurthia zopfii]STX11033.1 Uncharacterised protein [Kurthia zopfii]VEI05599.1 Uncharacterised protein [Kurthia zopfii]
MIFYETECMLCKQQFKLEEGTKKYKEYKVDRKKKLWCDPCERNVLDQARKGFLSRY